MEALCMMILIIGFGSMGKRRLRLIKELFPNEKIFVSDTSSSALNEARSLYDVETSEDYNALIQRFPINVAFVCVSPPNHSKIILDLAELKVNIFSEINIINNVHDQIIEKSAKNKVKLFLSSSMLYRIEISTIMKLMKTTDRPKNYTYHIAQYLPDWHPWQDYKEFFASNIETNAIREILAIELPWIIESFGGVKNFSLVTNKISNLDIKYPDSVNIILGHSDGSTGCIIMDVVSKKPTRYLSIQSEETSIYWEGVPESLKIFSEGEMKLPFETMITSKELKYADFIKDQPYKDEIIDFFKYVNSSNHIPMYSFIKDVEILDIIDRFEDEY
jgi:predicted dehydrogenase